ncbi:hypothetical protein B0H63DRAFT_555190 [Podospora didyma]|uniref:Uncharacterized protein n=1 Tax=Podospora didyma TaxID=330526 RepID=A0AAE0U7J0_9PEZI|nr:hypothetical protein B0H63DRAFT_555190 [Podospora didyma]
MSAAGAESTASCTGVFLLEEEHAAFAIECPALGIKILGRADGAFPVDTINCDYGTLIYFGDATALSGVLECQIVHRETVLTPGEKFCIVFATRDTVVAIFQGDNPPEQDIEAIGTASVYRQ